MEQENMNGGGLKRAGFCFFNVGLLKQILRKLIRLIQKCLALISKVIKRSITL